MTIGKFNKAIIYLVIAVISQLISCNNAMAQNIIVSEDTNVVMSGGYYNATLSMDNPDKIPLKDIRILWKRQSHFEYREIKPNKYTKGKPTIGFYVGSTDSTKEKSYEILMEYTNSKGRADTVRKTQKYFIKKFNKGELSFKLIQGNEDFLYLNCGNNVLVENLEMGPSFRPVFGVTGGSKIMGRDVGKVTLVPTSPKVVLSVSSGGMLLGKKEYSVEKIPLPSILLLYNGRKVNPKKGLGPVRTLQFKAVPNAHFKQAYPADARYQVVGGTVSLMDGDSLVVAAKIKGGRANLSSLLVEAKQGNTYHVEITRVKRMNFKGQSETVKGMGELVYDIPIK